MILAVPLVILGIKEYKKAGPPYKYFWFYLTLAVLSLLKGIFNFMNTFN